MIIVSACLAGLNTRYDGTNKLNDQIIRLIVERRAIPLCPEQLGGLPTPRNPLEIECGDGYTVLLGKSRVLDEDGVDYSSNLISGAEEVLRFAKLAGIKDAILKDGSPSCGLRRCGRNNIGCGVTTALLLRHGINVSMEEQPPPYYDIA
ncbi:MAG: DUF523 domain-containing protein [Nitrospirae bacterium]|nr:MAG: DUF523 domain-containing protein [Nitrospirota bacterium]